MAASPQQRFEAGTTWESPPAVEPVAVSQPQSVPAASQPPPTSTRRPYGSRSNSERLVTLGIIGAVHVVAVVAIWTRNIMVEREPAPLFVNPIETQLPDDPPPPPPVVQVAYTPPLALVPPPSVIVEVPDEAPTAITVQEAPPQPSTPTPTVSSVITEARYDVDYLNNPKPAYPPLSRRLREEGVVLLKVHVRTDGSVADALVEKRSGSPRLDQAALTAVKAWHFVPARRGNEAVESWVLVPIEFALQG